MRNSKRIAELERRVRELEESVTYYQYRNEMVGKFSMCALPPTQHSLSKVVRLLMDYLGLRIYRAEAFEYERIEPVKSEVPK